MPNKNNWARSLSSTKQGVLSFNISPRSSGRGHYKSQTMAIRANCLGWLMSSSTKSRGCFSRGHVESRQVECIDENRATADRDPNITECIHKILRNANIIGKLNICVMAPCGNVGTSHFVVGISLRLANVVIVCCTSYMFSESGGAAQAIGSGSVHFQRSVAEATSATDFY